MIEQVKLLAKGQDGASDGDISSKEFGAVARPLVFAHTRERRQYAMANLLLLGDAELLVVSNGGRAVN